MTPARARRARPVGLGGESVAEEYLVSRGYSAVARNHHSREGEVDLIVERGELVVFVEVKARKPAATVEALDSVSPKKARKIVRAAMSFIQQAGLESRAVRFDVVCVELGRSAAGRVSQHIEGAFDASAGDDAPPGVR